VDMRRPEGRGGGHGKGRFGHILVGGKSRKYVAIGR
jgi:hypothetical protein